MSERLVILLASVHPSHRIARTLTPNNIISVYIRPDYPNSHCIENLRKGGFLFIYSIVCLLVYFSSPSFLPFFNLELKVRFRTRIIYIAPFFAFFIHLEEHFEFM